MAMCERDWFAWGFGELPLTSWPGEEGFNITINNNSVHSMNYEGHHFVNSQSSELVPLSWAQTRFSPLCSKLTKMKDSKGGGGALFSSPTHSSQQFQNFPITDEEYLACILVSIFSTLSFTLIRMQAATNRIWNVLCGRLEHGETLWRYSNLTLIVLMWRIGWAHNNARK